MLVLPIPVNFSGTVGITHILVMSTSIKCSNLHIHQTNFCVSVVLIRIGWIVSLLAQDPLGVFVTY